MAYPLCEPKGALWCGEGNQQLGKPKTIIEQYSRLSWETYCGEVMKLKMPRHPRGQVIALPVCMAAGGEEAGVEGVGTVPPVSSTNTGRYMASPTGFEGEAQASVDVGQHEFLAGYPPSSPPKSSVNDSYPQQDCTNCTKSLGAIRRALQALDQQRNPEAAAILRTCLEAHNRSGGGSNGAGGE